VDTFSGVMRPLVPMQLRRRVFNNIQSLAHPGICATRLLIASRYLWPGLAADVAAWSRDCTACQAAKVTQQALWGAVMKKMGIKHVMSTAFHPQSNGLMERAHRRLKDALKACLAGPQWTEHLPWVLLGLRAAPREDSGVSAAELVYGAPLTLPGQLLSTAEPPPQFFVEQLHSTAPCVTKRPFAAAEGNRGVPALFKATHVYVRSLPAAPALSPAYRGPYLVHRQSDKFFILRIGGRYDAVSIDRLKPHLGASPPIVASPPRRGRPPKNNSL
jgi:Integrase zinc binding domain